MIPNTTCRSCGARMTMVRTKAGKTMPLDPEPDPAGNVVLVDGVAHVIGKDGVPLGAGPGRYVSHFSTCPNASEHRRNR